MPDPADPVDPQQPAAPKQQPTSDDILNYLQSRHMNLDQPIQVDKQLLQYVGDLPAKRAAGMDAAHGDLQLLNFRSQGRGLPLKAGYDTEGGIPHVMPLRDYIKTVIPGEPTAGDYIKDTLSNAVASFSSMVGYAAENATSRAGGVWGRLSDEQKTGIAQQLGGKVIPETGEEPKNPLEGFGKKATYAARQAVQPSANVQANAPIGREVTGAIGSALGTLPALIGPGALAARGATALGMEAGAAKVAGAFGTGLMGAASTSQEMYDNVLEKTGDKGKALKAYYAGIGIGASYGLDFPALAGIDKKVRGALTDILVHGTLGGATNAAQTAAADAVWSHLTGEERPIVADAMKAFVSGGTVTGGARGVVRASPFAQRIIGLRGGPGEKLAAGVNEAPVPHEERLKSMIPWESVDDGSKRVVDDFKNSLMSGTTSDQEKERINRMVVVPPSTKIEQTIAQSVAQRGGKLVLLSHPGEPFDHPSMFDPQSGTVVLDAQASAPAKLFSYAAHEQGHLLAYANPDAFNEFFGELERDHPQLFADAQRRRIEHEPDQNAPWLKDPGLVRAETFSQVAQDVSGMLYTLGTEPDFVQKALTGPSKRSFAGFMDSVVKGVGKLGLGDIKTSQDRQLALLEDVNRLTGGRAGVDPKEAHDVASRISSKLNALLGQKYEFKGGVAESGLLPSELTQKQLEEQVAQRQQAYEGARKEQAGIEKPATEQRAAPETPEPTATQQTALGQVMPNVERYKAGGDYASEVAAQGAQTPEAEVQLPDHSELSYIRDILAEKAAKAKEAMAGAPAGTPAMNVKGAPPAPPVEPPAPPEQMKAAIESGEVPLPGEEAPAKKPREFIGSFEKVFQENEAMRQELKSPEARQKFQDEAEAKYPDLEPEEAMRKHAEELGRLGAGEFKEPGEELPAETEEEAAALREMDAQKEVDKARGLALAGDLDAEGKLDALTNYAKTEEGRQRLQQVMYGGLSSKVLSALVSDIRDDVGFRPTLNSLARALKQAGKETGIAAEPKAPSKPEVSLAPEHEDYKNVSKLVDSAFKNKVTRGALQVYRSVMGDVEKGKITPMAKGILEALSEASGIKKLTPKQIRSGLEQIEENRARGVKFQDEGAKQVGRKRKDPGLFAAFTPYREGENPALGDSQEHQGALTNFLRKANETLFDDFEAVRRAIKGKAKGEGQDVSLKETAYWGRVAYKQSQRIRQYYQKGTMAALADGGIDPFYDKPGKPSFDSYLLAMSDPEYSAVVKRRSGGEAARSTEVQKELEERGASAIDTGKLAEEPKPVTVEKGSGITPQEVARVKAEIAALPPKDQQAYQRAGQLVWNMTNEGLNWLVDGGNLSAGEAKGWRDTFGPHYVPHLSIWDPDVQYTPYGDGYQATTQISERVQGRTSRPYSPVVAAFSQAMQRAAVSEKNRVGKSFGDFVNANQDETKWKTFDSFDQIPKSLVQTGRVFRYIDNGEKRWVGLYGKEGYKLAKGMTRLNVQTAAKWLSALRPMTRLLTNMYTAWNVFFPAGNLSRDLGAAAAYSGVDIDAGFAKDVAKPSAVVDSLKTAMKAAFSKEDTPDIADFRRFQQAGGTTGMVELMSYENQKQRLNKEFERFAKSTNMAHIQKVMSDAVQSIEGFNGAIEQSTRYSAWKAAKARGLSDDVAAMIAKEITVNFNRRGTIAPSLGAAYAFGSANLAGLSRFAKSVGTKRGMALASGMGALGFMTSLYNRYNGGEDADGQNAWEALGDWEKAKRFRLAGGGGKFYGFPMPWGWNLPYYAGVLAEHLYSGTIKPSDMAAKLASEGLDVMNPLGAHIGWATMVPTALRAPAEIAENKDAFGRDIAPPRQPWELAKPNYERYFTTVSPQWKEVAHQLAMIGGNETKPGPIDLSPEWLEHVASFMTGGTIRNVYKTISGMHDLLTGQEASPSSLPGVSYFYSTPNPAGRGQRFQQEITDTDAASQLMKRAADLGDTGTLTEMAKGETGMQSSMRQDAMNLRQGYSELRKAWEKTESPSEKKELEAAMLQLQRAMMQMTQLGKQAVAQR